MEVGKCKCGLEYDCSKPEEYLEKLVANTPTNRFPCPICVTSISDTTTEKSVSCFVCRKNFASKIKVRSHIVAMHIQCKPYQCDYCDKMFKTCSNLRTHMFIHSRNSKEKCKFCCELLRKDYIDKHIQLFHSNNPPADSLCHICGVLIPASTQGHFKQHLQLHEGKTYKCPLCEKEYRSQLKLSAHKTRSHNRRNVSKLKPKPERVHCNFCSKNFASKHSLQLHMKTKHFTEISANRPRFPCVNCDKIFTTKKGLVNHESSAHSDGKSAHKCKVCGKLFPRECSFYRHMKTHRGEKNYKCDTCGLTFTQGCSLTRHQVVHTGEKPFECGICGQRFTQKPYMKVHEKTHSRDGVPGGIQKKTSS